MLELKAQEEICLKALEETCIKYEMNDYCSINKTCEQHICICKRGLQWQVFIIENGIEFENTKHEQCVDACLEVIKCCSYSIDEFKDASNNFKNILIKNNLKELTKNSVK